MVHPLDPDAPNAPPVVDTASWKRGHLDPGPGSHNLADPLEDYYRYIKCLEQLYPTGKDKQIKRVAFDALTNLQHRTEYANDPRWLYIWLKIASLSCNLGSRQVYQHMYDEKHCTKMLAFYKQWADELESAGSFAEARKVYNLAVSAQAQPEAELGKTVEEFEMRVARKTAQQENDNVIDDEPTRNFLGVLKRVGKTGAAPAIRESIVQNVKLVPSRSGCAVQNRPLKFNVFDENLATEQNNVERGTGISNKMDPAFRVPSDKENVRDPGMWTKQKIKMKTPAAVASSAPAFTVFCDESSFSVKESSPARVTTALKEVKPQQMDKEVNALLSSAKTERSRANQKVALKEVPMYDKVLFDNGATELSLEEHMAVLWLAKRKSNVVDMEETTCLSTVPVLQRQVQKSTAAKRALNFGSESKALGRQEDLMVKDQLCGNISFTANLDAQLYNMFNGTVAVSEVQQGDQGDENTAPTTQYVCPMPVVPRVPLAVYCDPEPQPEPEPDGVAAAAVVAPRLKISDEDKENMVPPEMLARKPVRPTNGVLVPSPAHLGEPDEVLLPRHRSTTEVQAECLQQLFDTIPLERKDRWRLDESGCTLAASLNPFLGERVAASTPCRGPMILSVPSFCGHESPERQQLDTTASVPYAEDVSRSNLPTSRIVSNLHQNLECENQDGLLQNSKIEKKLSVIAEETSRDFRHCSSSSGGGSTASSDGGTLRKRFPSQQGSCHLSTISEHRQFATFTSTASHATPCAQGTSHSKSALRCTMSVEKLEIKQKIDFFNVCSDAVTIIDPWDENLVQFMVESVRKRLNVLPNFHPFPKMSAPHFKLGKIVNLGGEDFRVEKLVGEGAFAKVFLCSTEEKDHMPPTVVAKVEKSASPWEFYVCDELHRRINEKSDFGKRVMKVQDGFAFQDTCVLLYEYNPLGTLLDVVNVYKSDAALMPELLVMALAVEMMRTVQLLHQCRVIHADLKPDNLLFCAPKNSPAGHLEGEESYLCGHFVKMIDFGKAIDLNLFNADAVFKGKMLTSGFQCCEMQDSATWIYQPDYFGLLGTIHVMLFGDYMRTFKSAQLNRWKMTSSFKRRWQVDLWRDLFDSLLNVPGSEHAADLATFIHRFQSHLSMSTFDFGAEMEKLRCRLAAK